MSCSVPKLIIRKALKPCSPSLLLPSSSLSTPNSSPSEAETVHSSRGKILRGHENTAAPRQERVLQGSVQDFWFGIECSWHQSPCEKHRHSFRWKSRAAFWHLAQNRIRRPPPYPSPLLTQPPSSPSPLLTLLSFSSASYWFDKSFPTLDWIWFWFKVLIFNKNFHLPVSRLWSHKTSIFKFANSF